MQDLVSPMAQNLRISVIIPHLNQSEMLARCLASLAVGRRQADEIIVVDNGSASQPVEVCAPYTNVRLLHEATPGPGPARNLGVENSVGDVLAFIDADCLADPDWLAVAATEMAYHDAVILGGDVRIAYVNPDRLTMLEAYESIYAYRMDRYIAREGFTGTGNLVVRRDILARVGPFAGIGIAEDIDWGRRATGLGLRIKFVADMKVFHPARTRYPELKSKWDRHIGHAFTLNGRKLLRLVVWGGKTVAMAVSPVLEIPQILLTSRIRGGRSRLLAFVCLAKIRLYRAQMMAWLLAGGDPSVLSGSWNRPVPINGSNSIKSPPL